LSNTTQPQNHHPARQPRNPDPDHRIDEILICICKKEFFWRFLHAPINACTIRVSILAMKETWVTLSTEIRQIPLAQLVPSPYNVRSVRTEARIAALAQSLAEDGQKEPITVYLGNDGESLILSGVTRYLAAQSLGWEMLDARVVVLGSASSPLAVVKASRLHNDTQRETDLDHALRAS
jgi:uncharacterized ParB-like nuclease family protein